MEEKCICSFGRKTRKMLLGRLRHRWEGNIKMDLKETGWQSLGWIYLAQDRYQWWAPVILYHKMLGIS
jgi:hypothetical protein